jgi:hypothetical protein
MIRLTSALLSLAALAGAVPVLASQAHFRAEPVTAPAEARLVVRDTVFRCGEGGCVAPGGGSRAAIVCTALVREVGPLRSFTVAGRSFDADALAQCNRAAR